MTEALPSPDWKKAVYAVALALQDGRLGTGDLSELRRLDVEIPASPIFWQILARYVEPRDSPPANDKRRSDWEQRWSVVLTGMARLPHHSGRRLGHALVHAGFSELRMRRLLRATGTALNDLFLTTVKYLAAKGSSVDWTEAAALVLLDPETHPRHAADIRRRAARDYYSQLFREQ